MISARREGHTPPDLTGLAIIVQNSAEWSSWPAQRALISLRNLSQRLAALAICQPNLLNKFNHLHLACRRCFYLAITNFLFPRKPSPKSQPTRPASNGHQVQHFQGQPAAAAPTIDDTICRFNQTGKRGVCIEKRARFLDYAACSSVAKRARDARSTRAWSTAIRSANHVNCAAVMRYSREYLALI